MAKYEVRFKCGHTETKQLFGPTKDRYKKIEWWQENCVCSECYKKQQLEKAEKYEKENNLIELTGSEKQIKWAKSIRKDTLEYIQSMFKSQYMFRDDEYIKYIQPAVVDFWNEKTEAKWWIDHRDDQLYYITRDGIKDVVENALKSIEW